MTDDELKAIRERLDAATPGPWEWTNDPGGSDHPAPGKHVLCYLSIFGPIRVRTRHAANQFAPPEADAEFIAHAPTDIAALLAEIERLQERCEQLHYDGLEE